MANILVHITGSAQGGGDLAESLQDMYRNNGDNATSVIIDNSLPMVLF
jgi:hypothetical protein